MYDAQRNVPPAIWASLTPQAQQLLAYLMLHGSVTQRDALLDMSIQSLTKRISELRKKFVIVSDKRTHKTTKQRYVRYFYKGLKPAKQVAAEISRDEPSEESAYEAIPG